MAEEVVQCCLPELSALLTNHTCGNAVSVDGKSYGVPIIGMWVLIVIDVRHTMMI
jgi:hypothetical protein